MSKTELPDDSLTSDPMEYVYAWFDNHPEPWNIDAHLFEIDGTKIKVYFADLIHNTWLVKITCKTAAAALMMKKLLYKTTSQMGIVQILKYKELFLFTDQRF